MQCPKCSYVRSEQDSIVPDWQCPKCGIVYAKFNARQNWPTAGPQYSTPRGNAISPADAIRKKADTTLLLCAISLLFCCLGGLLGTYVAYRAKQDADAGNLAAAERGIKRATVYMIISYVFGGLAIFVRMIAVIMNAK
jgi:hypothetical protein